MRKCECKFCSYKLWLCLGWISRWRCFLSEKRLPDRISNGGHSWEFACPLCACLGFLSGCSGFLPQAKNMNVRLVGNSKLCPDDSEWLFACALRWWWWWGCTVTLRTVTAGNEHQWPWKKRSGLVVSSLLSSACNNLLFKNYVIFSPIYS